MYLVYLFMLESLISVKTRLEYLLNFLNLANKSHLRGVLMILNESTNSIRIELNNASWLLN